MAADVEVGDPVTADLLNTILAGSVNRPVTRLVAQATQNLANNTEVALLFGSGSEIIDTGGYHSEASNTARITPTRAGVFLFTATIYMSSATNYSTLEIVIRQNGTTQLAPYTRLQYGTATISGSRTATVVLEATANGTTDYFEAVARQTNATATTLATLASGSNSSTFECVFQRDL